jgi:hypothetical protein
MHLDQHERSISELLRDLSSETATLVRQEMALARTEIAEKAKPVGASAVSFGGTALFALGAFGAATACFIALLALVFQTWAAALIIAAMYGIIALVLAQNGKKKLRQAGPPFVPQTTQTVKEDVAWAKTRVKSGMK